MSVEAIKVSAQVPGVNRKTAQSWMVALYPPVLVVLAFLFERLDISLEMRMSLFFVASLCVGSLLLRLFRVVRASGHSGELVGAQIHIGLHLVPFVFLATHIPGARPTWFNPVLAVLFFVFFLSGRVTWKALGNLFPSTKVYHIFYRCNSIFMRSIPLLYLATFVIPKMVKFGMIRRVGLFYFSIHIALLGVTALKIQSDLRSENQAD